MIQKREVVFRADAVKFQTKPGQANVNREALLMQIVKKTMKTNPNVGNVKSCPDHS